MIAIGLGAAAVIGVPGAPAARSDAPVFGESVVVEPLRGEVFVMTKPGRDPVPLRGKRTIPLGSRLDTRHGRVQITAAQAGTAGTDVGTFRGSVFSVSQRMQANGGLTVLRLEGGGFASCSASGGGDATRRLSAEVDGRWRTRGRFSDATAHGTVWVMKDTCNGTTTVVARGTVVVRDRVLDRSVRVGEGERYVARAG
jgi:hypothetical protein